MSLKFAHHMAGPGFMNMERLDMRKNEPGCEPGGAEPMPDSVRALRLISKIKKRYGLAQVQLVQPAAMGARIPDDKHEPAPSESLLQNDACLLSAAARLTREQMQINEALVAKIFQCQRAEEALRASEEKLHDLLAHQFQAKEEERKRISREIHDTLGQNLLALRMDVVSLHLHTSARHRRVHEWVGVALENLDRTIRSVRTIIADLRPFQVELGLEAAVEWELNKFRRSSGLICHLSMDERLAELPLSDEQTLTIYRTLQECLSNISRHSRATRVDVILSIKPSTFLMSVSDDGVGFDPAKERESTSYGLLGIGERLILLGGDLMLTSVESHGTTVSISIPLDGVDKNA
jgi:signal transduction histidine kinase